MTLKSRRDALKIGVWGAAAVSTLPFGRTAFGQDGTLYQRESDRWGMGVNPGQSLPEMATNGPWKKLRAVEQKRVFDIHVHAWETVEQGDDYRAQGHMHELGYVNYVDALIASMDRHGIARAALLPNFTAYEEVRDKSYLPHRDRFVLAVGWPPASIAAREHKVGPVGTEAPVTPQEVADEYERQMSGDGAKFIGENAGNVVFRGLMPRYSIKELHPVVDVILKHDVPLQFHTGWSPTGTAMRTPSGAAYETAAHWAEVVGKFMVNFPEIKLILAHTSGQFGVLDGWEAIRLLYSSDNAYCDTAKAPPVIIKAAVDGIGAERVLFGSDWNRPELKEYGPPFMRATYQHWYNLNSVALADISEDQRDWVLPRSRRSIQFGRQSVGELDRTGDDASAALTITWRSLDGPPITAPA